MLWPPGGVPIALGASYESYDLRLFTDSGVGNLTTEVPVVKSGSTSVDPTKPGILQLKLGEFSQ